MSGGEAEWRAALALFELLLEKPAEEREVALAASGAEPAVQARVRKLLTAQEKPLLIDEPLLKLGPAAMLSGGERLGRWMLLEEIGHGGMSTVWRARSMTEPIGQQAALKRLAPLAIDDAALRRFEREMGILAKLNHPGIASLLDAGHGDDGVPWFAMTLVDGQPIDAWCAAQEADTAHRIALLRQACAAVAHAHRHLVVHRDIKPSNVLVDRDGRVVLLDFGISRLLEESLADSTGTYAFTPRFAAPEQRIGGAISTATDVWGLGALAYWLLTSEAPLLAVGAEAVEPPAALPADLRAILRQALQRDPTRRYASADAVAEDLQAFLDGRPVRARHGGMLYRFGRAVRRHPGVAALSLALVASLVIGTVASQLQSRRAEAEAERARVAQTEAETAREQAEHESRRAEALRRFTVDLFAASSPGLAANQLPTTRQLLDRGIERARDADSGPPELRADMLLALADILSKRLQFEESQALLDEAKELAGGADNAPRDLWGRLLLYQVDLYRFQRQYDRTGVALDEGIAWLETNHPESIELLEMLRDKAGLARHLEDFGGAEAQLMALMQRIEGRSGLGTLPLRLAGDLANLYGVQGRTSEALAGMENVLALKRADPTTSGVSMANTLFNLGSAHWSAGNITAASRYFSDVLTRLADVRDPLQVRAATLHAQARMAHALGDAETALATIDLSAAEWARAVGRAGPDEHFFGPHHRGRILADLGRHEEAMASMREAIRRIEASSEAPADRIAATQARMAAMNCEDGDAASGEALLAQALRAPTPAPPWAQAEAAAHCALARDNAAEAVAHLEAVQRRGPSRTNDPEFDLMRYEVLYAEALAAAGRTDDARRFAGEVRNRLDAIGALPQHVLRTRIEIVLKP